MTGAVAIIQARMSSTRLPGKVAANFAGRPALTHVVERAQRISGLQQVIVATTTDARDDVVAEIGQRRGVAVYRGSETDVLDRYYQASRRTGAQVVMRITADCPLLDPEVSGAVLSRYLHGDVDYVSNIDPRTFPDGLDTEVFSAESLTQAWQLASLPDEREHVTPFIRSHIRADRRANVSASQDLSALRWTLDYQYDLDFLQLIYTHLTPGDYRYESVLRILAAHPELTDLNTKGEGQPVDSIGPHIKSAP